MSEYPALHAAAFVGLLAVAALQDVRERKVANVLSAALASGGLAAQLIAHGALAALSGLGAGLIIIFALWIPWSRGGIGAGDVKLAAAAAVWLGLAGLPLYVLAGGIAGGIVSLAVYARAVRAVRAEVQNNLVQLLVLRTLPKMAAASGRTSVPYAVAVGTGAVVAMWWGGTWI